MLIAIMTLINSIWICVLYIMIIQLAKKVR